MSLKKTIFGILFLMITVLPPKARPASSDGFPWSTSANNNGGSTEVSPGVKRDAYGALRDSNMLPDTVPQAVAQNPINTTNSLSMPLFTPGQTAKNVRNQASETGANQNGASAQTTGVAAYQNGMTMQTGVIAPGGTVSYSGVAQGNIGPTQSGPGAAGLFTPNSPGNAAAYDAQVRGGLTASPIVDGNGANVRVTVPVSTPSTVPAYQQFMGSSYGAGRLNSGNNLNQAQMSGINNPSANPTNPAKSGNARSANPGRTANPSMIANPSMMANPVNQAGPIQNTFRGPALTNRVQTTKLQSRKSFIPIQRATASANQVRSLGDINGSITYADGQKVLFGTGGTAIINSKTGTLAMPNGRTLPLKSNTRELQRTAEKGQIRL